MEKERKLLSVGNRIFCTQRNIVSAVKREFVSDIILDFNAPNEEKSGDSKESFMKN
jgi:hypothetical protein